MTARSPWAIYVAILALVAAVSVAVYYNTGRQADSEVGESVALPDAEPHEPEDVPAPRGVRIEGGEVEQRDEQGKLLWRVRASGDLVYDDRSGQLQGSDIEFELYRKGQPSVQLQAPRFLADYNGQRLDFADGIRGTTADGAGSFEVRHMEYQASVEKLVGSGGVRLRRGEYLATADQIVIDVRNRQTRMHGNVLLARRR